MASSFTLFIEQLYQDRHTSGTTPYTRNVHGPCGAGGSVLSSVRARARARTPQNSAPQLQQYHSPNVRETLTIEYTRNVRHFRPRGGPSGTTPLHPPSALQLRLYIRLSARASSSLSSLAVVVILPCENSSVGSPSATVHSPPLHLTGGYHPCTVGAARRGHRTWPPLSIVENWSIRSGLGLGRTV